MSFYRIIQSFIPNLFNLKGNYVTTTATGPQLLDIHWSQGSEIWDDSCNLFILWAWAGYSLSQYHKNRSLTNCITHWDSLRTLNFTFLKKEKKAVAKKKQCRQICSNTRFIQCVCGHTWCRTLPSLPAMQSSGGDSAACCGFTAPHCL